jgi:hypothetical protein
MHADVNVNIKLELLTEHRRPRSAGSATCMKGCHGTILAPRRVRAVIKHGLCEGSRDPVSHYVTLVTGSPLPLRVSKRSKVINVRVSEAWQHQHGMAWHGRGW